MEIKSKLLVFVPQGIILLTQFSLIPVITFNTKNTGLWISEIQNYKINSILKGFNTSVNFEETKRMTTFWKAQFLIHSTLVIHQLLEIKDDFHFPNLTNVKKNSMSSMF